jgi:hypothetical protein
MSKGTKITGVWRNFHKDGFQDFVPSLKDQVVQHVTEERNVRNILVEKSEGKRNCEYYGITVSVILQFVFKNMLRGF